MRNWQKPECHLVQYPMRGQRGAVEASLVGNSGAVVVCLSTWLEQKQGSLLNEPRVLIQLGSSDFR